MIISDIPQTSDGKIDLQSIRLPDTEERVRILEASLSLEILAEIGSGIQGRCFLLNDQKVFKITDCEEEAALASYLVDNPNALFPKIDSVHRLVDEFGPYFAIIREEVGDVFDEMNDDNGDKQRICRIVWPFLNGNYELVEDPVFKLAVKKHPEDIQKLTDVYISLNEYAQKTGITVTDLVFSNIGRTDADRIVMAIQQRG
jgi:hypothetical protein